MNSIWIWKTFSWLFYSFYFQIVFKIQFAFKILWNLTIFSSNLFTLCLRFRECGTCWISHINGWICWYQIKRHFFSFYIYKIINTFLILFQKILFIHGIYNIQFYRTLLHNACHSGNIDLVKYLISLNEIDLISKDILSIF